MTQNISEYGSASLLRAAEIRDDNHVLLQIKGQDCIAREIKYHRSCYKNYVRFETLTKLETQNSATEDKEFKGYSIAFGKLCHYVQSEIIIKTRIFNMTELVEKFGKQLHFSKPSNPSKPELAYSANVEKEKIVESVVLQSDMADGGLESRVEETDEQNSRARRDVAYQVYYA